MNRKQIESDYYSDLFNRGCKCLKTANHIRDPKLQGFYLNAAEGYFMKAREAYKLFSGLRMKYFRKDLRKIAKKHNSNRRFNSEIIGFVTIDGQHRELQKRVLNEYYTMIRG